MVAYTKIRAVSCEAARKAASNYALADYGREYDATGERWYVLVYSW